MPRTVFPENSENFPVRTVEAKQRVCRVHKSSPLCLNLALNEVIELRINVDLSTATGVRNGGGGKDEALKASNTLMPTENSFAAKTASNG